MNRTEPVIITLSEVENSLPNYRDYAYVLEKVVRHIRDTTGKTLKMYLDEEEQQEVWSIIEDDLKSGDVELLANVYDFVETKNVAFHQRAGKHAFSIKQAINNSIYYYAKFEVALVRLPVFQSYTDYQREFFFAESDEQLLEFLTYVYDRQRELMKNHVSVFTDTEDGVERSKEQLNTLVSRDDVLMEEALKTQIYRSIDEFFLESGDFFRKYDIPYKRGILLYGEPGNGKTTLVKSIASSVQAPVAYWQITEYTTSYSIQEVFSIVAKMSPMVLVIEDIDSMPESVRSVFLNTLDGATSKEGIFLIGTTNYPEKIDPALINRAGRFDRAYEVKKPEKDLRLQYLQRKQLTQFMEESDVQLIAEKTSGFSVAQLNELYTSAALQWHYENKVDIDELMKGLEDSNQKARTFNWNSNDQSRVGFGF